MPTVVTLDHVTKRFATGQTAVDQVFLAIDSGQAVALLGPNGAGKSTSISLMLGLIGPTTGHVRLYGGDPRQARTRTRIGVMLQGVSVVDRLSVVETVNLFRSFYPHPLPLKRLLSAAQLEDKANARASGLSGGQMRRLQFALSLAGDPEVLFLDEPTVGMDVSARRAFWEELRSFLATGRTLLLTTHDLQEADSVADRVIVMNQGKILADDAPEQLKMAFAGRQVSFVAGEEVTVADLHRLPEVLDVQVNGRHVIVRAGNSDRFLRALFNRYRQISDVLVSGGGLEDAFVRLTEQGRTHSDEKENDRT